MFFFEISYLRFWWFDRNIIKKGFFIGIIQVKLVLILVIFSVIDQDFVYNEFLLLKVVNVWFKSYQLYFGIIFFILRK